MKKLVIISGYFDPIHGGHLDMIEAGKAAGDKLIVIVNNDVQQMLKKGQIINTEQERLRVARALRDVDEAVLSIDQDPPVINTIEMIAKDYAGWQIIFGNGGDKNSDKVVPETAICERYGISMIFDMGGNQKSDSSTRINTALGLEGH